MGATITLDLQINRLGFWSAVVAIATTVITFFIPLDVPDGYTASHADRVAWLSANSGTFILGWINQIAAMLSLSGVFFAMAWHIATKDPLRAIIAAMIVFTSFVAFIIPKFIAVWTIPLLAQTISTGAVGADLADPLLRLLNVSVPFSLYTSFDYLGFWLYAVFGLLVAGPLYGENMSAKIAAVTIGVFGLLYHGLLAALMLGAIAPPDIESSFLGASGLLLIVVVAMIVTFRRGMVAPSIATSSGSQ
ncbi:MAG: hypothetical protein HOJ50_05415 [Proteobacteria bacterium]|jgi:hypothetical protein|nr:hypothetical protein [Gammaproteobacteria bacterium]MBT6348577.1 hypothetical protein [Pseudomonadota bacterium]